MSRHELESDFCTFTFNFELVLFIMKNFSAPPEKLGMIRITFHMLTIKTRPCKEKLIFKSMTATKFYREQFMADKTKLRFQF